MLNQIKAVDSLNDNVTYLKAAQLYRQKEFEKAADAFRSVARRCPRGEKREAALFMTAVATMKTSVTYIPANGDPANFDQKTSDSHFPTDQAWNDAVRSEERR